MFSKNENNTFKCKYTFEKRLAESTRIKQKYPTRVPIIVYNNNFTDLQELDKHKYLVPNDMTLGQFIYIIRNKLKLEPEKALFMHVNNTMPPISILLSNLYKEHCDKDGYLYCTISSESAFG